MMIMGDVTVMIREATAEDLSIHTAAGLEAMNWSGEARFTYEQFTSTPELSHYLEGCPGREILALSPRLRMAHLWVLPGAAPLLSKMPGMVSSPQTSLN
jgi:hypothetical protein